MFPLSNQTKLLITGLLCIPRKGNMVYEFMTPHYSSMGRVEKRIGWEAWTGVVYDVEYLWGGLTDSRVYKDTGRWEMEAQNLLYTTEISLLDQSG